MNIALTGATGFLARHLIPKLHNDGHVVRGLGRKPNPDLPFFEWDSSREPSLESLDGCDVVIHLAGETVAQRWTAEAKKRIRESRVTGTRNLVAAMSKLRNEPKALLSASAVGIYGDRGAQILTEESTPGEGFLAETSEEWEAAAREAEARGVRVVNLRFGVILGGDGGAFPKMATPFKMGIGGRLGPGDQWMPWVHIDDVAGLILFALHNDFVRGPINVTAPDPVTNADFTRTMAEVLHRPALVHAPAFALKLVLGEMAEAVLSSVRAIPAKAQRLGFDFRFPGLQSALENLS